ncbi:PspC domain-containing protein [Leucobacter sp. HY1910]
MTSQPDPSSQQGTGFFGWLRDLGVQRGGDRWLAGVASGLATRAGIDPLIVRGIFVVLGIFGGPAVLAYVAGWLLLPDSTGKIHLEDIVRGRASSGVITAAIIAGAVIVLPVILFGITSVGGVLGLGLNLGAGGLGDVFGLPGWLTATFAWLFWLAVVIAGGFWLRHWLIQRGRAQATGSAESLSDNINHHAERFSAQANKIGDQAGRWSQEAGERVDAWSARLATEHDARKIGAGHVLITLAFALLAAGLAAFLTLQTGFQFTASGSTVAAFAAPLVAAIIAALAVLALSLIVAGLRGRHVGVLGFLSFCGVVALLITAVLPWGTRFQPVGEMLVDGRSAPGAVNIVGNVELGLSDLDRHTQHRVNLDVWQVAGDVNVTLPASMPTVLEVRMLAGRINEQTATSNGSDVQDRSTSGPFISRRIGVNLAPRATVDSPGNASRVTVTVLAGTVDVTHPELSQMQQWLRQETN